VEASRSHHSMRTSTKAQSRGRRSGECNGECLAKTWHTGARRGPQSHHFKVSSRLPRGSIRSLLCWSSTQRRHAERARVPALKFSGNPNTRGCYRCLRCGMSKNGTQPRLCIRETPNDGATSTCRSTLFQLPPLSLHGPSRGSRQGVDRLTGPAGEGLADCHHRGNGRGIPGSRQREGVRSTWPRKGVGQQSKYRYRPRRTPYIGSSRLSVSGSFGPG
jgi:hypothetical protein